MNRMTGASEGFAQVGRAVLLAIKERLELHQRPDQALDQRPSTRAEDDPVAVTRDEHRRQAFEAEGLEQADHRPAAVEG